MLPKNRAPIHPGEILLEEFLKPVGITQTAFAKHLGWSIAKLNEVVHGKRGITPRTALDIAEALGTDAAMWMNMQRDFDLWHVLQKRKPLQ